MEKLNKYNESYKEETMEDYKVTVSKIGFSFTNKIELDLSDTHEVVVEEGKTYVVRKKPQYPKTYEECCDIIGINRYDVEIDIPQPYQQIMSNFFRLRICRDAYWKIAGEEMGLEKPWEPDYSDTYDDGTPIKYVIYNIGTHIVKERKSSPNHILSFPTEEMRDAFYENFKDLIEQCKELL